MKKIVTIFLLLTLNLMAKSELKVGYPVYLTDMYLYMNLEISEYSGVYVDLLKEFNEENDNKYEFDFGKKSNKSDIILRETKIEDENYLPISTPFSYRGVILVNQNSKLRKVDDLFALDIGYVKNQKVIEEVKNRNKKLKFNEIEFETENQAILALKNKSVDAIIVKNWNETNPIEREFKILDTTVFNEKIFVKKDNEELYKSLENYFDALSREEIIKIKSKNRVEFYRYLLKYAPDYETVREKYEKLIVSLPQDEYYLPLYYKENNEYKGLTFDILRDIEEILEIPIEVGTKEESQLRGIYIRKNDNKETVGTTPYYQTGVSVATKGTSFAISKISDLDNSKIIIVRSCPLQDYILSKTYGVDIVIAETIEEGVKKLLNEEGEYLIAYSNPLTSTISNKFLDDKIKIVGNFNDYFGIELGVKSSEKELLCLLETVMESYSVEEVTYEANTQTQVLIKKDYSFIAKIVIPMILIIVILAILLRKAILNKKRAEKLGNTLLQTMVKVNKLKESESGLHAKRISLYVELFGKKLNLPKEQIEKIKLGAILHDIGKIIVPSEIINKKGVLTPEEFAVMKEHAQFGYELLESLGLGDTEKNVVRYHHEKWNGKGYPMGLKENEIPLEGRIMGVLDTYDSMREDKIYKKGVSHEIALDVIKNGAGKDFDPELVKIFIENEDTIKAIFEDLKEDVDLVEEYYKIIKNN